MRESKAEAVIGPLDMFRAALEEAGVKVQAELQIARLKATLDAGGDIDTAFASIAAVIALMRPALYLILEKSIVGRKITAKSYLDAEDRTGGKKVAMAEALDVTTQALHEFETQYAEPLSLLRVWRAETSTLELMVKRTSNSRLIPSGR